jgi:hypothetical protein
MLLRRSAAFCNPLASSAPAPPAASKKAAAVEARNREGALVAQIIAQKWRNPLTDLHQSDILRRARAARG